MISGIYKIQNKPDGKLYVGSAVNLKNRIWTHKTALRAGIHTNSKLQRAWLKYGEDSFIFETLLYCSKENLLMYEQLCIDGYDAVTCGYNICPTAGNTLGRPLPQAAREKIGAAHKGNKYCIGRKQTQKVKDALLEANVGRRLSDSHKAKLRETLIGNKRTLGVKLSEKQKSALRQANLGNKYALGHKHSDETRARMSASRLGKKGHTPSQETRAKIGMANRARVISEDTRSKMSEAQKARQERARYERQNIKEEAI